MNSNNIKYIVVPKVSIRPNKVVFYQEITKFVNDVIVSKKACTKTEREESLKLLYSESKIVESNKHKFEISKKASANIKEKVSWLYQLAKNKTVTLNASKKMFTFKMNFITLTLPSEQIHQTADITKKCLNQFLTECKQRHGLVNYVWRLEFQKNGNVHYHIATDSFIDYTTAKLIWNRCLQKLNYITAYQNKMSQLSFQEYRDNYSKNGKIDFNTLRERYYRGVATRWDSPNTVDVKCVGNAKNIAFYISKYITKKSDHNPSGIVATREHDSSNLRLWYCSNALSKLKSINEYLEAIPDLVHDFLNNIETESRYIFDYCKVWYFNTKNQVNTKKKEIWLLFNEYAKSLNYSPG